MIEKIQYKNFRALRDSTLPLGRFTLIVGANGTGKSTAIKALEIAKNSKQHIWDELISLNSLLTENNIVSIHIYGDQSPNKIEWKKDEKAGRLGISVDNFNDENVGHKSSSAADVINAGLREIHQKEKTRLIEGFKLYDFDSDKIAEPVSVSPNIELEESGRNLAGILDQLRDSDPEKFEELNNELNHWFPEFDRILFEVPNQGTKSFLLRTTIGKHKIKAKDLSDGTRLALAYLTIAYLPNPPKIVAFEEPEKGIHPRLLENIQEAMYRLAYPENYGENREPVQVIATTHSPYLLDLYKDYPEEIVISSKDENGVHFERLIDKPHYEEIVQDAPLGEVWFTGVLGGVPVQP